MELRFMTATVRGGDLMLGYLPYNEEAIIYTQGAVDDWGIKSAETKQILPCYIREVRNSERLETVGGSVQVLSYVVVLEGKVEVKIGDYIEVEGHKYKVQNCRYLKDLDRNIISTKVTI